MNDFNIFLLAVNCLILGGWIGACVGRSFSKDDGKK